jgi:hypothetical protein
MGHESGFTIRLLKEERMISFDNLTLRVQEALKGAMDRAESNGK